MPLQRWSTQRCVRIYTSLHKHHELGCARDKDTDGEVSSRNQRSNFQRNMSIGILEGLRRWASMGKAPFNNLLMPLGFGSREGPFIPGAILALQVPQHLKVAA